VRSAALRRAGQAPNQALGQILALDELHHDRAGRFLQAVDVRDVGMVQCGERLRFAIESSEAIGILRERVGHDLDRDVAIQLRVSRAIDLADSACAERSLHFIGSEARTGDQCHELGVGF
jgi:hypothetical protein